MRYLGFVLCWMLVFGPVAVLSDSTDSSPLHFEVTIKNGLLTEPVNGRLFVILSRTNNPEPRFLLGKTGPDAPIALARDIHDLVPGATVTLDETAFGFTNLSAFMQRAARLKCSLQALFDSNIDLRSPNAPGNLYSSPQTFRPDAARRGTLKLELACRIPPEQSPDETEQIKFVKIESKLLSRFHGRPIFLRAGIVLPRDYEREPSRRYGLWVRIGGLNTRYTVVTKLMARDSDFRKTWLAGDTPRLILLQLDGAGPYGDPYQINSANNGPYGDAVVEELIPHIEARFRAIGKPQGRVLSGTSTGGWASLALQIFYPDFFNGTWSSCPDPVDFRAFELVNIYEDANAFVNQRGYERPSMRDSRGDVSLTMRDEVGMENLLGSGNSYTRSGQSWGAWNALFGPRGKDGLPAPLWDAQTGKINHAIAGQWKKYDLRLVLEQNWKTLGPKLSGKLHIASAEADQYFLNNAVHLLEESLSKAEPPFSGKIVYGPGKAHGWTDLLLREMLDQMKAAAERETQ